MSMLAFDSVRFLQWLNMDALAPFAGFESFLNGFFLQCQFYFGS